MTRKIYLYSLFAAISLMFGSCDYNENNFPGFDDNPLEEIAQYEGDFTGAYPDNGYFIVDKNGNDYVIASEDAAAFQTSMNDMMKKLYPYADKTSSAKISNVLTGEVTKGMDQADISYTLVTADYDAMGTENGQPGRYNNFEEDMDIDGYLTSFCATKYADEAIGTTVNITYVLYTGSNSNQSRIYEKTSDGWIRSDMKAFTADFSYTLQKDDYDSMGTNSGEPGRYDNFDSGMNPDFYLPYSQFSSDKKYFRILASFSWSPSPAEESEVSSPEYHCIYTSVYPVYQIPVKVLVLICGGAAFFFLYRRHKKNHISQKDVP